MVLTLIQQGLGLRPREKRALCGKMTYMDFFSTSLTLIQSRNNVVCPVLNGPCRECGHDMSVTVLPRSILGGGGGVVTGIFESDKLFISLPIGKTLLFSLP